MNSVTITPQKLNGEVLIQPSKSLSHRAIICAGLAKGDSIIQNVTLSDDIVATCNAIEALGAIIEIEKSNTKRRFTLNIKGNGGILKVPKKPIDCNESGSTLRFMIPICLQPDKEICFTGRGRLIERPLDEYIKLFNEHNINYSLTDGKLPIRINGKMNPGVFNIDGKISSQYISGLLFALPLLDWHSELIINELNSRGYIDLTIELQRKFGIEIDTIDKYKHYNIKGNQKYKGMNYKVEGDFSQAAFWAVAGALGSDVKIKGLEFNSYQLDKEIFDIINKMGAKTLIDGEYSSIVQSQLKGIRIDASQIPDLVPIIAVLASFAKGTTTIYNAERLRYKESDRLKAVCINLKKLSVDIEETSDGLVICGKDTIKGGTVDSFNDHRIAMAMAIASTRASEPITILGSNSVKKSYPQFWEDFCMLGGKLL